MLDADTEALTGELADALVASSAIDPRNIPTRFSLLKRMAQSPAHYYHAAQQPQDDSIAARLAAAAPPGTKRGEALRLGNACHLMLLGETDKVSRFPGRRAGKTWEAFERTAGERGVTEILSEREFAIATGIVETIRRHPIATKLLLEDTLIEQRIDWTWMGKAIRCTPDARASGRCVDLKTAVSAEPGQFVRTATRLFYHAQAALYLDAIEANKGERPSEAFVIAVEKSQPHPVTILRFTKEALDYGAMLCRSWMERLLVCEQSNEWPGYLAEIGDFHIDAAPLELEIDGQKFEWT